MKPPKPYASWAALLAEVVASFVGNPQRPTYLTRVMFEEWISNDGSDVRRSIVFQGTIGELAQRAAIESR